MMAQPTENEAVLAAYEALQSSTVSITATYLRQLSLPILHTLCERLEVDATASGCSGRILKNNFFNALLRVCDIVSRNARH